MHAHFLNRGVTPRSGSIMLVGPLAGSAVPAATTVSAMTAEPLSAAGVVTDAAAGGSSRVPADHPAINELFALLAYGEVAAFHRLTEEARMAPDLRGRINMASMAAAEMGHYEQLRDALAARGVDVVPAITRYAPALENYHRLTTPSTWLEALVKTYVGDAMAADFYLEIADVLPDEVAGVVRAVLSERATRSSWSPRCARPCCPADGSAADWRCGRDGSWVRPSPRRSTCLPNVTNSSSWCSRAPADWASGRLLRPVTAHTRRPDASARAGLISGCRSLRWRCRSARPRSPRWRR